jgi:hypothetical protein
MDLMAYINRLDARAECYADIATQAFSDRNRRKWEEYEGKCEAVREIIIELLDDVIAQQNK